MTTLYFPSFPNSMHSQWQSKVIVLVLSHLFLIYVVIFKDIVEIVLVMNMNDIFSTGRKGKKLKTIKQS